MKVKRIQWNWFYTTGENGEAAGEEYCYAEVEKPFKDKVVQEINYDGQSKASILFNDGTWKEVFNLNEVDGFDTEN